VAERRTFTETARRDQIVRAAIETLAELGYAGTSLGKIARTAGLSSVGMISYYFTDKAELMAEVASSVLAHAEEVVGPKIVRAPDPVAKLRAYIEASLAYIGEHRAEAVALIELTRGPGATPLMAQVDAASAEVITRLVVGAQAVLGGTEPLEPRIVAMTVRGAINNAVWQSLHRGPDSDSAEDLARDGRQIAGLIERSLRADPLPEGEPCDRP
jgi:AcrR family transcriptional regulator